MRKVSILALATFAALAVAALILSRGGGREGEATGPTSAVEGSTGNPALLAAAGAVPQEPRLETTPAEGRVLVGKPGTVPEPRFAEQPTSGVDVIVTRGFGGEGVARADVDYLDLALVTETEAEIALQTGADMDGFLRRFGRRYRADRHGKLRVPSPIGDALLAGGRGDLWWAVESDASDSGPILLNVLPDSPVRVRVVDSDGRPVAGVPVVLRSDQDSSLQLSRDDGRAELPHAQFAFLHGSSPC